MIPKTANLKPPCANRMCTDTTTAIVRPVMVGCIVLVHLFSLILPPAGWDIPHSPQDIIIVHAVVAFAPEMVGLFFVSLLGVLLKMAEPQYPMTMY